MPRHLTRAVPWRLEERLIDQPHQFEVLRGLACRRAIERGARNRNELALPDNGQPRTIGIDHHLPPIQAQRSKALAKKSRSTTSWPILAWSFITSASRFDRTSKPLSSKTFASFSIACRFHCVIRFECYSCRVANSAIVRWPWIASSATLVLNSAVNRPRIFIVDLPSRHRIHLKPPGPDTGTTAVADGDYIGGIDAVGGAPSETTRRVAHPTVRGQSAQATPPPPRGSAPVCQCPSAPRAPPPSQMACARLIAGSKECGLWRIE